MSPQAVVARRYRAAAVSAGDQAIGSASLLAPMPVAMSTIVGTSSLHGAPDSSKVIWMARHLVDINL